MKMSRTKIKNSAHSYERAKERTNIPKRRIKQMMKQASISGVAYGNLPNGPIKDYIGTKGNSKRVKVYMNHVFIFAKNSTACITMYPLDQELIDAQKEYDSK